MGYSDGYVKLAYKFWSGSKLNHLPNLASYILAPKSYTSPSPSTSLSFIFPLNPYRLAFKPFFWLKIGINEEELKEKWFELDDIF